MEFKTIKECVDQLLMCDYECEAGFLKNNTAFIRLKEISELPYQPAFFLSEKVMYDGEECSVRSINASQNSNQPVTYDIGVFDRHCDTIITTIKHVVPISIIDHIENKVAEAKQFLKSQGITTI